MKNILISLLLLLSTSTFAQQVENVAATQQGSSVLITYDLAGSPSSPYFVKLLMSKNGGQSFSQPLKYVTGDVGNAKAGSNKKIIWSAKKELIFYNGDAVFRVEATSLSAPMPEPVEDELGKIEIISAKQIGSKIIISFTYTAFKDFQARLMYYQHLIDESGNKYTASRGSIGNVKIGDYTYVVKGLATKCKLEFSDIMGSNNNIPLLTVKINGSRYTYSIKNIPLSK